MAVSSDLSVKYYPTPMKTLKSETLKPQSLLDTARDSVYTSERGARRVGMGGTGGTGGGETDSSPASVADTPEGTLSKSKNANQFTPPSEAGMIQVR